MREAISPAHSQDLPHILLVDDDERLRALLKRYLAGAGFRVTAMEEAEAARRAMAGVAFDLVVLDIMLPGESGLELSAALTASGNATPILLPTAMDEPEDRVRGLEAGAEDYMVKPFEPRELVLRIRTILRRRETTRRETLRFGPLAWTAGRESLEHEDGSVRRLAPGEAVLLSALSLRGGGTVSREELAVMSVGSGRAVDVQVARLRRKLEPDPKHPRYLVTIWGRGYALRPD